MAGYGRITLIRRPMSTRSAIYEMSKHNDIGSTDTFGMTTKALIIGLALVIMFPFNIFSATLVNLNPVPVGMVPDVSRYLDQSDRDNDGPHDEEPAEPDPSEPASSDSTEVDGTDLSAFPDTMLISYPRGERVEVVGDSIELTADSVTFIPEGAVPVDPDYVVRDFNPDPKRAVWLSALFPGLGQLYNRRYWKLPLVVGGFMGLAYGMSWNNQMLGDYTQAYRAIATYV